MTGTTTEAAHLHEPAPRELGDDGRRARRDRNRDAVIEALLAFYDSGNLAPGTDAVAERAGISPRSLFRYFADLDDLARTAVARQQQRLAPLFARSVPSAPDRGGRVRAAVDQRVGLLDAMGPVGKVARLRAPFHTPVADELRRVRHEMRRLLAEALRPDLDPLPPDRAASLLAALDVACSFEAYELLRDDIGMSPADATERMVESAAALVDAATSDPPTSTVAGR